MPHFLVLLVLACAFANGSPMERSPDSLVESMLFGLTGRIVNGTKATSTQFPYQVSLRRSWSEAHFCGGSIISPLLVLTAAHCTYLSNYVIEPWTILVVAGELKLKTITRTGQRRGVKAIKMHPEFDIHTLQNDVAILRLSIPFAFTPEVQMTALPMHDFTPKTLCSVSGWGYPASDNPKVSDDLMYVELPIREIKECRELLVNVTKMLPGMFCAGFLQGGKDACQGDSGGGMVCNGILTGVVSGGEGCAFPMLPGVYSNTFYFKEWIQTIINDVENLKDIKPNSCAYESPKVLTAALLFIVTIMIGP